MWLRWYETDTFASQFRLYLPLLYYILFVYSFCTHRLIVGICWIASSSSVITVSKTYKMSLRSIEWMPKRVPYSAEHFKLLHGGILLNPCSNLFCIANQFVLQISSESVILLAYSYPLHILLLWLLLLLIETVYIGHHEPR